jgi:hypothetical protein
MLGGGLTNNSVWLVLNSLLGGGEGGTYSSNARDAMRN